MSDEPTNRVRRYMDDKYSAGSPLGLWLKLLYELIVMFIAWAVIAFSIALVFDQLSYGVSLEASNMLIWAGNVSVFFTGFAWCWSTR